MGNNWMKFTSKETTGSPPFSIEDIHFNDGSNDYIVKAFTMRELRKATMNFSSNNFLGEESFGKVFRGWIDPKKDYAPSKPGVGDSVVVKKSIEYSEQLSKKQIMIEVNYWGKFSHPNLVKLLGYCYEEKHYYLVYEYMPKGSLANHLFGKMERQSLSWNTRLKIARGVARGFAFLHNTEKRVMFQFFKSSNILLDESYNPKLSDFGLKSLGPNDYRRVFNDVEYTAPEFVQGNLSLKSDVYVFGVLLLELMIDMNLVITNKPHNKHNLVIWAKSTLPYKEKLKILVDRRRNQKYSLDGACKIAKLILQCIETDDKLRPDMNEVLEQLEGMY